MSELQRLLEQVGRTADCTIAAARGQPTLRQGDRLPDDLAEFYSLAGGVSLFEHADYSMRVVGPEELVRANPEIRFCDCPDDISDFWYIVVRSGDEATISIDCSAARLGRCYDSFWDCHAVVGSCPIVALSFTELMQRMFEDGGGHPYWCRDDELSYGDAYGP